MKTVLVTGAGGFIGGAVVREFLARGWRVDAAVRRRVPEFLERRAAEGRVRIRRADLSEPGAAPALFAASEDRAPPEARVHCAGRASDTGRRSTVRRANFDAVRYLERAALERGVGRFIFVSTTDVYGLRDFHGEDEDALPLRADPTNPYPEFKIAAEQWIREHLPSDRYAILRPAQVWGPGDTTLTPRLVEFLRRSPFIVHFGPWRGANRWPLAHVRNVAAAAYLAAVSPRAAGRAIHVLDNERTSIDEWTRLVAALFLPGRRFRTLHLPMALGATIGWPVERISSALNLDHPFADPTRYAARAVGANLDFDNGRLRALFASAGRALTTREEGLRELRVNIQDDKGKAKVYQVRQVLKAIERWKYENHSG